MFDDFARGTRVNGCFTVLNISPQVKTIKIFLQPINYGGIRDLLQVPGVGEDDIRVSLLKGELRYKIKAKDIVVICSDIDLLQFNLTQKAFLQSSGIVNGLEVGSPQITQELNARIEAGGSGGITAEEHERLRQFVHLASAGGPGDGFASGAVKITSPFGATFPTSIVWFLDNTLSTKIIEKHLVYNSSQMPTTIVWNLYDVDGITIIHTIIDTITYTNNIFETSRTRTIL